MAGVIAFAAWRPEDHETSQHRDRRHMRRSRQVVAFQAIMAPRSPRIFDDVDPTGEEQSLQDRTGIIERDDRGQARWVVHAPANSERTFDLLKALDNERLAIEGSEAPKEEPPPLGNSNLI